MAKATGDQIFRCKESFSMVLNGKEETVHKGSLAREGSDVLPGHEMYFEPMTVKYDVEQASAAPGEKRKR